MSQSGHLFKTHAWFCFVFLSLYLCAWFMKFIGLLYCRYTWLHCTWGTFEERIWNGMWLVSLILWTCALHIRGVLLLTLTFHRWSLGAIMFEMLVGYPPFYSEDPMSTCRKVCVVSMPVIEVSHTYWSCFCKKKNFALIFFLQITQLQFADSELEKPSKIPWRGQTFTRS